MRNPIRRLTAWLRNGREPATREPAARKPVTGEPATREPAAPASVAVPAPEAPAAKEAAVCGVYVWATAHGIDLRPRHPLLSCRCAAGGEHFAPAVGTLVVDARDDRPARVVATDGPRLRLRPPAGGPEWDAPPSLLRPATEAERLHAKVAEANRASRWGSET
ncbi:hypothetical protein ACSNOH_24395 [Streptomyces sp. URMC 127]|uniref:hypothetical protein n=1 Tax=Streptomyces sp. URMC 127 TaxID=3423402 RepID=UPI003F1DD163